MKHSPAPWKVIVHDYDEDGNYIPKEVPYGYRSGDFGGNPYIVDANGETVAGNDEYYAFSTPENVRLMVHAPDLLEALKGLLSAMLFKSIEAETRAATKALAIINRVGGA
jgi:hypothetical protein